MKFYLSTILLFLSVLVFAQPQNDECFGAINISNIENFCSNNAEFTNAGANPDPNFPNNCFLGFFNGVWFSFVATRPAITAQVLSGGILGDLEDPRMALYSGNCNNLNFIDCSPGRSRFEDEFTVSGLTIGQRYYLHVESATNLEGTFELCINAFFSPPSPESDCPDGVILCDKSPFQVESLTTAGNDITELNPDPNNPNQCLTSEFNSSWYKWTCDDPGSLTFTLTPNNYVPGLESDDIDFALFELPNGIDDCSDKIMVRCMASGANGLTDQFGNFIPDPFDTWSQCSGPTGLSLGDPDTQENPGCQGVGDNNFADGIQMEAGKSYALVIMNFSRSGLGFSIEFGGTGTFQGPEPDFEFETIGNFFECDKRISIENRSFEGPDMITNYSWNFGLGAEPQGAFGVGPHEIIYESFGQKSVVLTVETSRGCILSKVIDIDIEACCADTSTLDIITQTQDVLCNGEETGAIIANGLSGSPFYNYSIDGIEFLPFNNFNNLAAGTYDIIVQDQKGCEEVTTVTIEEPPLLQPDAGLDLEFDLGFDGQLNASYSPVNPGDIIEWTPPDGLSCTDCLNPVVNAPGTTTYTFTVTDANGCMQSDQVTVRTIIIRPIFYPNVITPTSGDINSKFRLELGRQAELIEEFTIFDRWGNPIYTCQNIDPQDTDFGWDGRFGSCTDATFNNDVNPGVYVFLAKVRFIDQVVVPYVDDITVIK